MAKTHTGEPESASVQPSEVLSGLEAVSRTERIICRGAVTREPAEAEGMALAGVRAASLADAATAGFAGTVALPAASCVHHVSGAGHHAHAGTFELAARSVQEAADLCLAAHVLSRNLVRDIYDADVFADRQNHALHLRHVRTTSPKIGCKRDDSRHHEKEGRRTKYQELRSKN